jgi:hypothetical protein
MIGRRFFLFAFLVVFAFMVLLYGRRDAGAQISFKNAVQIDGLSVGYPDGWSVVRTGNLTTVVNAPPDQAASLDAATYTRTARIEITVEPRPDDDDAVTRLGQIAAETNDPASIMTIGGWPAIQRRHLGPKPQPGALANGGPDTQLNITTAVAAGAQVVRFEGILPGDSPSALADVVTAIETKVTAAGTSVAPTPAARQTGAVSRHSGFSASIRLRRTVAALKRRRRTLRTSRPTVDGTADTDLAAPGGAAPIIPGGQFGAGEPEVAVSSDGRQIVVGQQFTFVNSTDGGQTFSSTKLFPSSSAGDCSLAFAKTNTFYEGTINQPSTAINVSTDGGSTFTFKSNAFTCPMGNCGGFPFPDQEHIGASGDRIYSVWRNGGSQYGIVCSTDGGGTWSAGSFSNGDFPRITVSQDGSVYVVSESGSNIMVAKYAACAGTAAMSVLGPFPKQVASINELSCPVPGLDRCNRGNTLRSPMIAVDDSNASHLYVAYATEVSYNSTTNIGNDNVIVQDSTDGGVTWPRQVTLNSTGTGLRFMPWVCATNGTAFVSWYDRRAASATSDNDLTDYFGATASISAGNLVAGGEFQINAVGTADKQCEAGKAIGSAGSWPFSTRVMQDSESCSRQPQLAGVCGTSQTCSNTSPCPAGLTCDGFYGICRNGARQQCDFDQTACPTAGDSCQPLPSGGGVPKYGDYNGNACAVGHFYTVWASATPPAGITPSTNIDLFFAVRDTVQPVASCKNVIVPTDSNLCSASGVSVDNGSTDPDGDTFSLSQSPPNPYSKGMTPITLTITDQNNITNTCTATVTVLDQQKPTISCPSPVVECPSPAGASVALNPVVSDNCPGLGAPICAPPSGSTFPLGTTPFSCTVTDASTNSNSCNSVVKVQDTTPPIITSVSASPRTLWPPNHKFVPVQVSVAATDICDLSPICTVTSVASSEPPTGGGSGNTSPDFQITGPLGVALRAERAGTGNGRTYTLAVRCVDHSNNISGLATTTVTVAHDERH